jgi:hypothetical protein
MSGTVASRAQQSAQRALTVARQDVARVARLLNYAEPGSARAVKLAAELAERKANLRGAEQRVIDVEAEQVTP